MAVANSVCSEGGGFTVNRCGSMLRQYMCCRCAVLFKKNVEK